MINGQTWRVVRVPAGDPRLTDRTGTERLATTDPRSMTVAISEELTPPMLDKVLLHEVAHAVTVSWALLPRLHDEAMRNDLMGLEEWAAQLVENHSMEAIRAASESLGRPLCVMELCVDWR